MAYLQKQREIFDGLREELLKRNFILANVDFKKEDGQDVYFMKDEKHLVMPQYVRISINKTNVICVAINVSCLTTLEKETVVDACSEYFSGVLTSHVGKYIFPHGEAFRNIDSLANIITQVYEMTVSITM